MELPVTRWMVFVLGVACVAAARDARSAVYEVTPQDDWFLYLTDSTRLAPGDELVLGAGTYSTSARISISHRGMEGKPIVIRAAQDAQVVITRPDANQNVLNLEGAQFLVLQGLEITGGSIGVRLNGQPGHPSKFITLDGNHIHHTGDAAVTANFNGQSYEGMHFVRNEIDHTGGTGEGFYLGCNNNACQFFDSVIEQNYIHHLNGSDVTQGDGIEIKDGSFNNVIRDNVIHDTNYPGILVYGVEEQGAPNIIEGNVIWRSGDHAIQAAADAVIRNNLIFSSSGDGVHSQNHQGAVPGNLTIVNNTIRTSGNAIDVGSPEGGTLSGPIVIANNALYPDGGAALDLANVLGYAIAANVGTGASNLLLDSAAYNPTGDLATDFVDLVNDNAFPALGSRLIGAGDAEYLPSRDFNGTLRTTADVGAYAFAISGNPGWSVAEEFKQLLLPRFSADFNGDGAVDRLDLEKWKVDWGVNSGSDADGNGFTDGGDLLTWQREFGLASASQLGVAGSWIVVPEPMAWRLGMVVCCWGALGNNVWQNRISKNHAQNGRRQKSHARHRDCPID